MNVLDELWEPHHRPKFCEGEAGGHGARDRARGCNARQCDKIRCQIRKLFGSRAYRGLLEKQTSKLSHCHSHSRYPSDQPDSLPHADLLPTRIPRPVLCAPSKPQPIIEFLRVRNFSPFSVAHSENRRQSRNPPGSHSSGVGRTGGPSGPDRCSDRSIGKGSCGPAAVGYRRGARGEEASGPVPGLRLGTTRAFPPGREPHRRSVQMVRRYIRDGSLFRGRIARGNSGYSSNEFSGRVTIVESHSARNSPRR